MISAIQMKARVKESVLERVKLKFLRIERQKNSCY